LVLPVVGILAFFGLFMFVYSFRLSLFRWPKTPVEPLSFCGLENYKAALSDPNFRRSLWVTFKFAGLGIPLQFWAGLGIALALNRLGEAGKKLCVPLIAGTMVTDVGIGIMWYLILSYHYGPISYFLDLLGLQKIDWLGTATGSFFAIVMGDSWTAIPFMMMVLYAGLISLPRDIFEAAAIDGASGLQMFSKITLPLLKPVIVVALVLRISGAIKTFGLVRALTEGRPGGATEVISYYIFNQGFSYWNLSYASALTFLLLPIIVLVITAFIRAMRGGVEA
jgi:multiple sugar transport system permease protein